MRWSGLIRVGSLAGALLLTAVVNCGGMESDDQIGGDDSTGESGALWRRHRPAPRPPTSTPTTTPTPTSPSSSSGLTTEQVIAAAQTSDGRAIPQPSGANGACPEVVVRLGFWSCPTINDTCSFTSGGRTTHCTCTRTDGEGQLPSWVCQ